ncbi:MAG: hypothetical protein ACLT16_13935 [[Clostridium] innocuum]
MSALTLHRSGNVENVRKTAGCGISWNNRMERKRFSTVRENIY